MRRATAICTLLVIGVSLAATSPATAQPPQTMTHQGMLRNADGTIVADGEYDIAVELYDSETGGLSYWGEIHLAVPVVNGLFNLILGKMIPLTIDLGRVYWLGVRINGGPELAPRMELTSVPYAFRAAVADTALAHDTTSIVDVHSEDGYQAITGTWTQYGNARVTIEAPGPGYISIASTVAMVIQHFEGYADEVILNHAPNPDGSGASLYTNSYFTVPQHTPDGDLNISSTVRSVHPIVAAGTYTYYLVGRMDVGESSLDRIGFAQMFAEFHHDPTVATRPPAEVMGED